MDRQLIEDKLEALRACVKRIEAKRPAQPQGFASDQDIQDIVSVNITRAVQLSVDIAAHIIAESAAKPPGTMGETFDLLAADNIISPTLAERMKKAVGFRNIAVHSYQAIDWNIVYNICHHNLEDFREFAKSIAKHIEQPPG